MIIFYNSKGEIKGYIDGRIHTDHLKIDNLEGEEKLNKLVIEWKAIMYFDKEGNMVEPGHPEIYASEYEPDHEQADLIMLLEKNPLEVYNYSIDLETKKLIKK